MSIRAQRKVQRKSAKNYSGSNISVKLVMKGLINLCDLLKKTLLYVLFKSLDLKS